MASQKILINITLTDGTKETEYNGVRWIMSDMGRWDIVRSRKQWPSQDEAPTLWMQVVTYYALVRTGQIPTETVLDSFLDTIVSIEPVEDEEAAEFPAK